MASSASASDTIFPMSQVPCLLSATCLLESVAALLESRATLAASVKTSSTGSPLKDARKRKKHKRERVEIRGGDGGSVVRYTQVG